MTQIMRHPARSFQPGDWVRWRQGPVDVTGKVVACVPRGRSGAEVFLKLASPNAEFVAAPHRTQEVESYLVRVTGTTWERARVYWPMARSLEASDWVKEVDVVAEALVVGGVANG
jgi:hypothetical protein